VTAEDPGLTLQEGVSWTGMTFDELWLRQLALGGDAGRLEVEAYVLGLLMADSYQHDVLAQALNEWSLERGGDHPVGYWRDGTVD
jgi:hypothetical protein